MKRTWSRIAAMTVVVVFTVVGTGCALFQFKDPEESLRERVSRYMQARVDGRWSEVYDFFESSYRAKSSRETFLAVPVQMDYLGFAIQSIELDPSEKEATVKLGVDVSVKGFEFKGTPEVQHWIKEGKTWYLQLPPAQSTPF